MQLKKATLRYLSDLKENNNREWYHKNKDMFQMAQSNAKEFYQSIMENLNRHDDIDKFKLFRIYRDVRFSKDKTPYNPHFAGSFSRTGKKLRGGYYLRIRPGESFLAGGFWDPNKEDLFRIRKEFEYNDGEIRNILSSSSFKEVFNGKLEGKELKTAPKGFDKEHAAIDLIRKKGFIAVRKFRDKEVLNPDFINVVDYSFLALRPFFDYMSDILTTNLNGESLLD
jgi:uncharacterized protein (TIGR02453 family)